MNEPLDLIQADTTALTHGERMARLEQAIRENLDTFEPPVTHHFAPGIYAREMFIPAGTVLTGKIHKTEHLCMVIQGEITVTDESGSKTIRAPCTFVSKPGTKRAGYAHTDTIFTTIHATPETDLDRIEEELVCLTFEEYEQHTKQLTHEATL